MAGRVECGMWNVTINDMEIIRSIEGSVCVQIQSSRRKNNLPYYFVNLS